MNRNSWMDELQKNLSDLIARSPAADVQRNVKAMMTDAFGRLDLVTREEFDVQAELLARTRARVEALETRLQRLEAGERATPPAPPEGDMAL
ncbi:accessory factor UbiK family protein [Verticiella sediminum]|uniref:Ubiquinone biosynthesis accessory factor UbiK n=1 Tax=Verticiella sediminum TaxID=1247510 RepID=A0A556B025_9BURK|nr:accessory factor UbiK family protein [Verticiella sediminum]TSH98523.1 accessory factor UbiK family protein [Verticiella sediminum]